MIINIAQRRKIEAAIRQLDIALIETKPASQQYFLEQAGFHLAEARRTGFDHLVNAGVVEYETSDGTKLMLDVLFDFDGESVGMVAAFVPDSKHNIVDLLDYDVLVDLIIESGELNKKQQEYDLAAERRAA